MRMLVTGIEGQVARALAERAGPDLEVIRLGRPELDLATAGDLTDLFAGEAPEVIVNAAAHTAVDRAESEPGLAHAINAIGAGAVARAAADLRVPIIQLSTDYVFDGSGDRPLSEDDPTAPINVYGASKLAGEDEVAAVGSDHVILRTSWVHAPFGANFVRTMLRLAESRDEVAVVGDQWGRPTSALDIAAAIETIAGNLLARPGDASMRGVFHLTASGEATTWAGFAEEIFRLSAAHRGPSARVRAITSDEWPTAARRPRWSVLDGARLAEIHGVRLPAWPVSLDRVVARLVAGGGDA